AHMMLVLSHKQAIQRQSGSFDSLFISTFPLVLSMMPNGSLINLYNLCTFSATTSKILTPFWPLSIVRQSSSNQNRQWTPMPQCPHHRARSQTSRKLPFHQWSLKVLQFLPM